MLMGFTNQVIFGGGHIIIIGIDVVQHGTADFTVPIQCPQT